MKAPQARHSGLSTGGVTSMPQITLAWARAGVDDRRFAVKVAAGFHESAEIKTLKSQTDLSD
jgi:hypothetical protein